jgi:uncharacterized protein (DUF1501 family)
MTPLPKIHRRTMLEVGYSAFFGLGLPTILGQRASAAARTIAQPAPRAKSVILVFLPGGLTHHDTLDPKPDAPVEIRGEFKPIDTKAPGVQICEHLPKLAARADRFAVVRSLAHDNNNHLIATHLLLTGHSQPGAFFDKVASRDDWPCYSAACDYLRPRTDAMISGVNLPHFLKAEPLTWPGQHAGFLGPKHDPWQILGDPNDDKFRVDALNLATGIDVDRFRDRQTLLSQLGEQQRRLAEAAESRQLSDQQHLAFSLLTSSKLAQAFELDRESTETRERYGRNKTGQALLIARRLAEAGVPLVQVNVDGTQAWDHHAGIFPKLKDKQLPPLDAGVAALLDDLKSSGLEDDVFVMLFGEFGRSPKISVTGEGREPGRDHWAYCFSGLFAGAGVRGGQVIGKSDAVGGYPLTTPYSHEDVGATVYRMLGVDPTTEIRDRLGRPVQLNHGTVIQPLFSG